jgi:hypothetical protein
VGLQGEQRSQFERACFSFHRPQRVYMVKSYKRTILFLL